MFEINELVSKSSTYRNPGNFDQSRYFNRSFLSSFGVEAQNPPQYSSGEQNPPQYSAAFTPKEAPSSANNCFEKKNDQNQENKSFQEVKQVILA